MDQTGEAPDDVVNRALKLLGRVERLRQDGATFYVAEKKLFQRTRALRKLYFPQ
jgi:hypothetical protein